MRLSEPCPVDDVLPELKEKVRHHRAVVLHAPPGAGKTTRVPLALLDVLPRERGRIVVLEPRRLAAVSAARWMAQLLGEEAGETVGYSIRFNSRLSGATRVEVVTEGVLTRRIQNDPGLGGIGMVVFDEFHERSLHSDLALSLCLDICSGLREDLKLLVMSATLDCGPVSSLLGGAPVVTSSGHIFPVEERFLSGRPKSPVPGAVTDAVRTALTETDGDILVFLPGAREIRGCMAALQGTLGGRMQDIAVYPLYGGLSFEEQEHAILPSQRRKIILATNIAETSLTVEGVRVVIDSGLTRRLRHDPSTGMNRLVTVSVSKAEAQQRKGRAGRLAPGVCYRLYSRHDYRSMIPFAPPAIRVSDLSSAALELAAWGVRDPLALSWLDPPPAAAWEEALCLLTDLGALDRSGSITVAGRTMVGMPLHPRLAKLLLRGRELGCPGLAADLAALLSERDVLRRDAGEGWSIGRDVVERMDLLESWRKRKGAGVGDTWALRRVDETSRQLMRLMSGGRERPDGDGSADMIPRLLLCAFPDRIARKREEGGGRFVLTQGRGVRLPAADPMAGSLFIIAVNVDAGEGREGVIHLASPVNLDLIRRECPELIGTVRRVVWDKGEERINGVVEERIGSVVVSSKPFTAPDEEAIPFLCGVIRTNPDFVGFGREARQFLERVSLLRRVFPEEPWPDLSEEHLLSAPGEWLPPWLSGVRSKKDIERLDIPAALRSLLSRQQLRLLEVQAPLSVVVPSGRRLQIDYTSGEIPVLAVKVQEMFGLADSPEIAGGRVKLLLHLLSPAHRPVQITQDLRAFWENGYREVRKELKGRYPKHPWPDDPWNAVPTHMTKARRS